MARIRTIKPNLFTSRTVSRWPVSVRWTFAGLFTYLDDKGRGLDEARLVKAELYPLDDPMTAKKVEEHLTIIATTGPLCRYTVAGEKYLHVTSWREHQRVNRPTPSKIPPCPKHEDSSQAHDILTESSLSPHYGKGREGNKEGEGKGASVLKSVSQSSSAPREVDDDGLTRIQELTGGTKAHARKTAAFVLSKAPADVRNPAAYVLAAVRDDLDAYRFRRGNPRKGDECPTHAGEWGDACRGCAADRKASA